ncbi:transaldolase family protein, partial [Vibrio harveyi]
RRQCC